jgi:hypothetical protein
MAHGKMMAMKLRAQPNGGLRDVPLNRRGRLFIES